MKKTIPFRIAIFIIAFLAAEVLCAQEKSSDISLYTSVDTGLHVIDEDLFIPVLLEQGFTTGVFDIAVSGPLRFRVKDNRPDDLKVLRDQDWDDPSDWARIVRKFHFNKTFGWGTVDAFIGELNGVHVGYQNVVSHYYNSTDMDHYHGGFDLALDINGDGLEMLLDDVVIPSIIAARVYLAPLGWFSDHAWAKRLEVGMQFLADRGVDSRTMDIEDTNLVAFGGDIGFAVVDADAIKLTPYLVLAAMDGDAGFHGGATVHALFSKEKQMGVRFQTEYRYMGEDYYPALVNPFYDNNRRFFTTDPATRLTNTFADHLANTAMDASSAHGFMVDLELTLTKVFRFGARYDYQSRNRPHWILFRMEIAPSQKMSVRAFYGGQDVDGGRHIFSLDSLIGVAYQHQIIGPLRAFTEFSRRYRRIDNDTSDFANDYVFGVGLLFQY
ncbi:MAG: hypothetical protein JXX29_01655 [Deltaproteobacteria bacterium]|nr:hypothetical protein [Deltaproteobacteria bacterium]MBN2670345.1 hypothetical protein [Deltaproteobacteria bacterium]